MRNGLRPAKPIRSVALLGAHCDDIAIGAGGLLLSMAGALTEVHALVLTGGGTAREAEEHAALDAFCARPVKPAVLDLPDGRLPAHWAAVKEAVEELRAHCEPDLVLAPHPADAHQDHRLLAELVPTVFREHLVLGYEIPKWDADTGSPPVLVPLSGELVQRKTALLGEHYPSQRARSWFDPRTFEGLARIRGVQCHAEYAEAFHTTKLTMTFEGADSCTSW
ncbi:PIG-L deacetylase family protein [Sciscionella sediminilitoris]|uniref:PIG-L deacetylase family protein n=1 Tax=Sciscionella sediminilitoris TaxID=1445613 RepID=UPI000ABB9AF5|nr:PIG-L deacetylase family protein [Sciscionella sp. SE31]